MAKSTLVKTHHHTLYAVIYCVAIEQVFYNVKRIITQFVQSYVV